MTREEAAMKLATHYMSCGMLMPIGWIDNNGEGSELFEAFKMAMDVLNGKDTNVPTSGWISVEERLPDEDVDVLTRRATGIDVEHYMGNDKWWNDCYADCWIVTHWMPLPEPPEVKSDGN